MSCSCPFFFHEPWALASGLFTNPRHKASGKGPGRVARRFQTSLKLYLHIHSRRQIELHQRVHRLVGGVDDVHQAQVRPDLELVARGLVRVRAAQHVETLDARRQRHRPLYDGPRALGSIHDLERRLVDQAVVERLEPDPDFLALYGHYSITFVTTPAPTVLPPSRMANLRPCSIAMGAISVT